MFTVAALVIKDLLDAGTWAGLSTVAIAGGGAVSATLLSSYMSRKGRRPGLVVGFSLAVVGALVAMAGLEIESIVVYLVGLLLIGVGGTGASGLSRYVAADLATDERRSRDLSWVLFSSTFGSVGGPLLVGIAGGMALDAGFEENSGPFALAAVLFVVATAVPLFLLRPDPLLLAQELKLVSSREPVGFRKAVGVVAANPGARFAFAALLISHAVMVTVMAMTPLHMDAHGHELGTIGAVISAHTTGMFAFSPIAGWVSDRVGRLPTILMGGSFLLVATVLTALASTAPQALMFPGLWMLGLGWSFGVVAGSALLTESVEPHERVGVQGASDVGMNASGGIGALGSGVIFEMQGYHVLSMIGTVAAAILVLQAFYRWRVATVANVSV